MTELTIDLSQHNNISIWDNIKLCFQKTVSCVRSGIEEGVKFTSHVILPLIDTMYVAVGVSSFTAGMLLFYQLMVFAMYYYIQLSLTPTN